MGLTVNLYDGKDGQGHVVGYGFNYVRPTVEGASFRDYRVTGFASGVPLIATIKGNFTSHNMDVYDNPVGVGAGWVQVQISFTSPASPISEYTLCAGTPDENAKTCSGKSDPYDFFIPAQENGKFNAYGKNSVHGFAAADGTATIRVQVTRAETVATPGVPNCQHPVSAYDGAATLTIESTE